MARRPGGLTAATELGRYVRDLIVEREQLWLERWPVADAKDRLHTAETAELVVPESWLASAEMRVYGEEHRFDLHSRRWFRVPDTDTLTASAKAYVNALNNLFARKEKSAPSAKVASGF